MSPLRKLAIALWIAVFVLAGALAARAWLTQTPSPDHLPDPAALAGEGDTEAALPEYLPPITLKDLRGETRSLSEWSGRTLVINFWATWCAPCRKEMPLLEQLQRSQGDRLQVIGIAIDRLDPVLRFVGEVGVTYPILVGQMDATRAAERFGPLIGLPLTVVVGPEGHVLTAHTGELHPPQLEQISTVAQGLAGGALDIDQARVRLQTLATAADATR